MKYVIGIDGGGTKTNLIMMDLECNFISKSYQGPSSIDTVDFEVTTKAFFDGIDEMTKGLSDIEIVSVFVGLGGVCNSNDEQKVINMLKTHPLLVNSVVDVKNDIYSAYKGGLKEDYGIQMIIGTGFVAFTINEETKEPVRVGGYGYKKAVHF